ncbi:MAG: Gmad2 immunoglobulin-like domain-containing protein [Gaiellaceae bacterium]
MKRALLAVAMALLLTGCAGDDEPQATDTETTPAAETANVKVYWLRDGKVWPALREIEETRAVASVALAELEKGPTEMEMNDLGFTSAVSADFLGVTIAGGVADPTGLIDLSEEGIAQIVFTLTQFSSVKSVEIGGKSLTRADFEDFTPAILVESPLPFEEVSSPLRVTGTANTFEATFSYELTDTDGLIVDENFVTATSGTGTRGTFDFTTKPYTVPFDGIGALIVFEHSAKDGSRINLVEIPLRMTR